MLEQSWLSQRQQPHADGGSYTLQMHCSIVIVFLKYPT
jgi:hypothetical protein